METDRGCKANREITRSCEMMRWMSSMLTIVALIFLLIGTHAQGQGAKTRTNGAGSQDQKQVQAIQNEVKQIDSANDAPETTERRRLTKELPSWQLSGLFEGSRP